MPIFRVEKSKNYTVMSNHHLREKKMSLKAIGLLSKMLSLPDDWDYSVSGLVSICAEGEAAVKATLRELQDFGYLYVNKVYPDKSSSGRIEYEYVVYETPKKIHEQEPDFQGLEIQGIENHTQLSKEKVNTKDKQSKDCGAKRNPLQEATASSSKTKKAADMKTMRSMISAFTSNEDVVAKLQQYFAIRAKKGLQPAQWKIILDDLRTYAGTNTEVALEQIDNAIAGGYMQIIASWNKAKAAQKERSRFDNTQGRALESVVSMTAEEKRLFDDSLAYDAAGNPIKF